MINAFTAVSDISNTIVTLLDVSIVYTFYVHHDSAIVIVVYCLRGKPAAPEALANTLTPAAGLHLWQLAEFLI